MRLPKVDMDREREWWNAKAPKSDAGMNVLRCGGLGSLTSLYGQETVDQVLGDKDLLPAFLDIVEHFDREILTGGPGTRQRAGLIAVAERRTGGR